MTGGSILREILDWILHIALAVIIGLLIVTYVAQRTVVFKQSMEPTLHEGDNLVVEKISPRLGLIKRGDIVIIKNASPHFAEEKKELIKRVVAVEGDTVEIKDGMVYINGEPEKNGYTRADYTPPGPNKEYDSLTLEKGYVYVLGDNRGNSTDSRALGPIKAANICGKAIFRFYPFSRLGALN